MTHALRPRTLVAAGALALFTALVHLVAGHDNPLVPMLDASFDPVAKRAMHAVWHIVSVHLFLSGGALLAMGLRPRDGSGELARFLAASFAGYALVFLVVGLVFLGAQGPIALPQWTLLGPVAVLAWRGSRS